MSLRRNRFIGQAPLRASAFSVLLFGGGAWFFARALNDAESERLRTELRTPVAMLVASAKGRLAPDGIQQVEPLVRAAETAGFRLTLLDARGDVLFDTSTDPARMENHIQRPEIQQALRDGWGTSTRWSVTVSRNMTYVAARVGEADRPEGFVRAALSAQALADRTAASRRRVWTVAATTAICAILLVGWSTYTWKRRLAQIGILARGLSRGDHNVRTEITGPDEVALLARMLYRLRDRLTARIATVERQRRTLESLVEQVRDGVVVADSRGRVVIVNSAARSLLQATAQVPKTADFRLGTHVEQLISQHELQRLLVTADEKTTRSEAESTGTANASRSDEVRIEMEGASGLVTVLARASDVSLPTIPTNRDADAEATRGRMLILTDISELVRALKVRSDFVANASHELRTPVAAIRGAVETLHTLDFSQDAAAARRFVEMIERHSGRLESLASDLLELSRIESAGGRFSATSLSVAKLSTDLHARWLDALEAKGASWHVQGVDACPRLFANAHLLDLILDNLVDNAIKFTPSGGRIDLTWRKQVGFVEFEVSDTGCGIPSADQERVFERFYQVAQARSEVGGQEGVRRGTGLGLSIVRHAATAMGGTVALRSVPGKGTIVTVRISQVEEAPAAGDGVAAGKKT